MDRRVITIATLSLLTIHFACGETRRPLGEECLRDDDCLSGVCAARACAAQPVLVPSTGGGEPTTPTIPDAAADS